MPVFAKSSGTPTEPRQTSTRGEARVVAERALCEALRGHAKGAVDDGLAVSVLRRGGELADLLAVPNYPPRLDAPASTFASAWSRLGFEHGRDGK